MPFECHRMRANIFILDGLASTFSAITWHTSLNTISTFPPKWPSSWLLWRSHNTLSSPGLHSSTWTALDVVGPLYCRLSAVELACSSLLAAFSAHLTLVLQPPPPSCSYTWIASPWESCRYPGRTQQRPNLSEFGTRPCQWVCSLIGFPT